MKRRSGASLIPLLLLLVGAMAVFAPALRNWSVLSLFEGNDKVTAAKPEIRVWVQKRSGIYYCHDSELYGKSNPGFFLNQGEALQQGYRPSNGVPCAN
jgi:hypothetical protein